MDKLKSAIIGCGTIFPMHAAPVASLENAELVAVCDIDEELAKAAAAEYGCAYYTDYKKMIAEIELDVVHICTPHYLHSPMAVELLKQGINVLCEKPMAISYEEGLLMQKAAEESGKTLGIIFQNRYYKACRAIKEAIESGKLGKVLGGRAFVTWTRSDEYYSKSSWRGRLETEGGGVVINQAIHTLDLARWFIGSEIQSVEACLHNYCHSAIEVEDKADGVITFESGAKLLFYTSNCCFGDLPIEVLIQCENGSVRLVKDEAQICVKDAETVSVCQDECFDYGGGKGYWGSMHIEQIQDYYDCILSGRPLWISIPDVLKTHRMMCAIYESGRNGNQIVF